MKRASVTDQGELAGNGEQPLSHIFHINQAEMHRVLYLGWYHSTHLWLKQSQNPDSRVPSTVPQTLLIHAGCSTLEFKGKMRCCPIWPIRGLPYSNRPHVLSHNVHLCLCMYLPFTLICGPVTMLLSMKCNCRAHSLWKWACLFHTLQFSWATPRVPTVLQ